MTRVYIADAKAKERSALRLVLQDLKMDVAGEAADWATTLAQAPIHRTDMLLIDWDLLPTRPLRLWMNSAGLARPHWSLSSSVIWTPVSKLRSPPAPMRLSVKARRLSV
jgi:DNA-binding NarL/FixJ family response regulator